MFDQLLPFDWEEFHFLRPLLLWLLVPVAVAFVVGVLSVRQDVKWKKVIAPHLRDYVIKKGSERVKLMMHLAGFIALTVGVLALSGPTWKTRTLPGQDLETPFIILLDMSQSMLATDLQPTRLDRAKFKLSDLMNFNPRARIALIGYAGTPHVIVPLTKDYDIIDSHLEGLKPDIMPFPGTDLAAALALADTVMSITDAPGKVLIVTDEIESSEFELLQSYTASSDNRIMVLPMNTDGGAAVPDRNGRDQKDATGNVVYSSLNRSSLTQIESLENVSVHQLTLDDSDVEAISKEVEMNLIFTDKPTEEKEDWLDAGLVLVIPMIALMLFWFRRGWVLYGIMILGISSCTQSSQFADLWFTKDYQGQRAMDAGNYEAAAELYEDPMHKGVAYFKAGDYTEAIKAFNQDTTSYGALNLGLAYLRNGDTLAAMLALNQAVVLDPENQQAQRIQQQIGQLQGDTDEVDPSDAQEAPPQGTADNFENKDMEDLGGGGQEATEEDMKKERKEETVATDIRKGKELDEVPEDIGASIQQDNSKVLMRKVDDDPSLFLKRKFEYQVKQKNIKPSADAKKW